MPQIVIEASTNGRAPADVFTAVADFESYPAASEEIQGITVTRESETVSVSEWAVAFRGGVMRWSERDHFDPATRTIRFDMIEGDSDIWRGVWTVTDDANVRFEVEFDLGMPALADQMNPLAVRALYDVIVAVLRGRIGADIEILTASPN